jgi:hypothetical protein
MRSSLRLACAAVLLVGCGDSSPPTPDRPALDLGRGDRPLVDAAAPDRAPRPDSALKPDGKKTDAKKGDSTHADAAKPDGGLKPDAGKTDAGKPLTCADLPSVSTAEQVQIVEADSKCAAAFVSGLIATPWKFLAALYALVPSLKATDPLFSAVYDALYKGQLRFSDTKVIDDLWAKLPAAIASCTGSSRCADWKTYIQSALDAGELYLCPALGGLNEAGLLAALPYGDYACVESIASALAPLASSTTVTSLLTLASSSTHGWSRRNAVRVIGRFAGRGSGDPAGKLVLTTRAADVQTTLLARLGADKSEPVLHDAIWVLDSYFFPCFAMQSALETIAATKTFDTSLRFRAITAWGRLVGAQAGQLTQAEADFLQTSLASDDKWVRAEAAFICQTVSDAKLTAAIKTQLIGALQTAYTAETELAAKVYEAKALDRFNGTTLYDGLRTSYEQVHLANTATDSGLTIRSGLTPAELPALLDRMKYERNAYFAILGAPFNTPVPGDTNTGLTLIVFATRQEYVDYMDAFVGYGSAAGGLYLEAVDTLYTFQRTPAQSSYTLEELIQHELGHYLQGRYVYPGLFGDSGYHTEPKGWSDEGMAEFLAGLVFDASGNYTTPLRAKVVARLCATTFRDLPGLLALRAGYDQPGAFDYDNAWSFTYYMLSQMKSNQLAVYTAYRNQTYAVASFASIAGVPSVSSLETSWHGGMQTWCSAPPGPAGPPAPAPLATDRALRMGRLPAQSAPLHPATSVASGARRRLAAPPPRSRSAARP